MVGDRLHATCSRRGLDALRQRPSRGGEVPRGLSVHGTGPDRRQAAGILREKGLDRHCAGVEGRCPAGAAPQPDGAGAAPGAHQHVGRPRPGAI
eukprot:4600107-Pyramimonas_sp.AAC.1